MNAGRAVWWEKLGSQTVDGGERRGEYWMSTRGSLRMGALKGPSGIRSELRQRRETC